MKAGSVPEGLGLGLGVGACRAKGGEIGGFEGGWLAHQGPWLGAQWAGLFLGVPSCPEPPSTP